MKHLTAEIGWLDNGINQLYTVIYNTIFTFGLFNKSINHDRWNDV